MPGKFQKPLFNIRARFPKQYRAFNPQNPLYEVDVRAKDADHALWNWKRGRRIEKPFQMEYSVAPYYGPEMPVDMARRLARKRAYELARQRRDNQMYAYHGQSDWDGGDFVSPIAGDNYYDMAKDFLWNGDLSGLDPEDVAIATEQLEPFREVTDDVAFGRMLNDRLGDREAYLFALRRGGRRKPPVWVNPENFDELDRRGWAGEDSRDEDWLWKYINWRK